LRSERSPAHCGTSSENIVRRLSCSATTTLEPSTPLTQEPLPRRRLGRPWRRKGVVPAGAEPSSLAARLRRRLVSLRVEEAIALAFLLPTTYLTLVSNLYTWRAGVLGDRQPGGLLRLLVAIAFLAGLAGARRLWPESPWIRGLRETVPFLACILIYT